MKLIPLDNKIIVEPIQLKDKGSTIIIPDTAKEKTNMGKVIAVGTGKEIKKLLRKGQTVLFSKHAGVEIKIEGKICLVIPQEDILAKILK